MSVSSDNAPDPRSGWIDHSPSSELSSHRTGMSFERTRMSADRTLMSIIRTALSLIGFGFTIFQFFRYLAINVGEGTGATTDSARNFGMALVLLGVLLLAMGIWKHVDFMLMLRREHAAMERQGLLHEGRKFPYSITLIISLLLFSLGLLTVIGMLLRAGPFN